MAMYDDLPTSLRAKAQKLEDFTVETEYAKAKRAGYAPDEEEA